MKTYSTGARPTLLGVALAVTGVMAASTLAHGQVAIEAGNLAAKNPPTATSGPGKQAATAQPKAVVTHARAPITGKVELAPQITLSEGKSTLMRLPSPATRLSVGDARIADVILLNPSELYMLGKSVGSTNLILWNKANDATIIDIAVGMDTVALRSRLEQMFASEKDLKITTAADTLILSGMVSDVVKADQILSVANAYVQRSSRGGQAGGAAGGSAGGGQSDSAKVVNMLSIAAPQQVMLEVKVAEISKSLLDRFGINFARQFTTSGGAWTKFFSGILGGEAGVFSENNNATWKINGGTLQPTITDMAAQDFKKFGIDAQKQDGLVKILAEPTIMAISGQEGSFLAGGKIFIPVPQGGTSGGITLEEKEFGVGVRFTPTVLEGGRINLKVAPEVSELAQQGARLSASGTSATSILPLITSRRASTTVQLLDGQSFAIGGLIKNNVTQNINAFPILGEIPIIGALFRSSGFQTDRTELVFIVTPRLVKPLAPDYSLPTDGFIQPSRSEFFLGGKMEGAAPPEGNKPAGPATGFEVK